MCILAALIGPNSKAPGFAGGYLLRHQQKQTNEKHDRAEADGNQPDAFNGVHCSCMERLSHTSDHRAFSLLFEAFLEKGPQLVGDFLF